MVGVIRGSARNLMKVWICCATWTTQGKTRQLLSGMALIALCDGIVACIFDDFLGQSMIIDYGQSHEGTKRLCIILGHIDPDPAISPG